MVLEILGTVVLVILTILVVVVALGFSFVALKTPIDFSGLFDKNKDDNREIKMRFKVDKEKPMKKENEI